MRFGWARVLAKIVFWLTLIVLVVSGTIYLSGIVGRWIVAPVIIGVLSLRAKISSIGDRIKEMQS